MNPKKSSDLCRNLIPDATEDVVACVYVDHDVKALVLPTAVVISTPSLTTRMDIDHVLSLEHDPENHVLRIKTAGGVISITSPLTNKTVQA